MISLKVTSIQAENADTMCAEITQYLGMQLQLSAQFINDPPWQIREKLFDAGEIQVSWMCGLPYVQKADSAVPTVELLAAPVMHGARYRRQAVYFSDVVVRADSRLFSFEDLPGIRWAYNEPNSHSGYTITRYFLATHGKGDGFFGQVFESGSHQQSLEWLLERRVDATAIDSTVLETELAANPALAGRLRRIVALGPSPIPPWTVHTSVPPKLRARLRNTLISMNETRAGRTILARWGIVHFSEVSDADYDPIRMMATVSATLSPW